MELFWSAFLPYFSTFGLNTFVSFRIQSECGKMREKWGPEYLGIRTLFTQWGFFEAHSWLSHGLHLIKQVYGKCMKLKSHNMLICHKGLPEVVLFMNGFMHHNFLRSCFFFFFFLVSFTLLDHKLRIIALSNKHTPITITKIN